MIKILKLAESFKLFFPLLKMINYKLLHLFIRHMIHKTRIFILINWITLSLVLQILYIKLISSHKYKYLKLNILNHSTTYLDIVWTPFIQTSLTYYRNYTNSTLIFNHIAISVIHYMVLDYFIVVNILESNPIDLISIQYCLSYNSL